MPLARARAGGAAQLRRRARRPGAAAVAPAGAAARDRRQLDAGLSRARDAARAGAGRHRARRHPHRRRGAGRAVAAHRAGARAATPRASSSWPARSSTSTRRKQLGEILFEKLQLPALKKTGKTRSASTAVEVLEELALTHELPRLILEWRGLHKLKSTYIDALPLLVQPGDRPRAHELQPGGRRDRAAEQLRSEPAEHPDPHRARPRDPPRVRRRAGPRADLGRLLADRAARARAPGRRRDADRGVPRRRGHPRPHGAEGVRRRTAASTRTSCAAARRSSTTRCSTARRRSRWPRTSASRKEAAQEFIDAYFAGFPRVRGFIDRTLEEARATGVVQDDVRPAAAGARPEQPQLPDARRAPSARRSTCRSRARPPTS